MTVRLRRTGRRVVVDLPVYAGWGPTGTPVAPEPRSDLGRYGRAMDQHRQHWPDDLGMRDMRYADGTTRAERLAMLHRNATRAPTASEAEAIRADHANRQRPSYDVAFTSARNKAERAADAGERVAYVTADEYMAVQFSVSMRFDPNPPKGPTDLVLQTPHGAVRLAIEPTPEEVERGRCKPDPAENARRHSEEGGTW